MEEKATNEIENDKFRKKNEKKVLKLLKISFTILTVQSIKSAFRAIPYSQRFSLC